MDEAARLRVVISAMGLRETQRGLHRLNRDLVQTERFAGRSTSALARIGKGAAIAGITGLTVSLGAAVRSGFKFNAQMESNELALRRFVGTTRQTRRYLDDLFEIAKRTPFEFTELTSAARRMMAFGLSASQTKDTLKAVGDAIAAAGGGAEEIQRVTRAFGQVQAKGKVYAEELLQFTEAGIPAYRILQRELKLTDEQLKDIGKTGIDSELAIRALTQGMNRRFSGAAREQARTWTGMMSTLRDNWAQTTGAMTRGLFREAKKWAPEVNRTLEAIGAIFDSDHSFEEKFRLSGSAVNRNIITPIRDEVGRMELGNKLNGVIERATPQVMNAMAAAAPRAAGAFVKAFRDSGPLARLFTVAFLAKKLGVFGLLGRRAADRFAGGFGRGGRGGGIGGAAPIPVYVVNWGGKPGGGPVPAPVPTGGGGKPGGGSRWDKFKGRLGSAKGGGAAGMTLAAALAIFGQDLPKSVQDRLFGKPLGKVTNPKDVVGPGSTLGRINGAFGGPNRGTSLETILGRFPQLSGRFRPRGGKKPRFQDLSFTQGTSTADRVRDERAAAQRRRIAAQEAAEARRRMREAREDWQRQRRAARQASQAEVRRQRQRARAHSRGSGDFELNLAGGVAPTVYEVERTMAARQSGTTINGGVNITISGVQNEKEAAAAVAAVFDHAKKTHGAAKARARAGKKRRH